MADTKHGQQGQPGGDNNGSRTEIKYRGERIPENSMLFKAFERMAKLSDSEIAKVNSVMEMFCNQSGKDERITAIQRQLDRVERSLGQLSGQSRPAHHQQQPAHQQQPVQQQPAPQQAADKVEPEKSAPKKKRSRKTKASAAEKQSIAEDMKHIEETVEERQARMAKMEKQERMKEIALKKLWDKQKDAKSEKDKSAEPDAESDETQKTDAKKKPRRKRKTTKKDAPAEQPAQ